MQRSEAQAVSKRVGAAPEPTRAPARVRVSANGAPVEVPRTIEFGYRGDRWHLFADGQTGVWSTRDRSLRVWWDAELGAWQASVRRHGKRAEGRGEDPWLALESAAMGRPVTEAVRTAYEHRLDRQCRLERQREAEFRRFIEMKKFAKAVKQYDAEAAEQVNRKQAEQARKKRVGRGQNRAQLVLAIRAMWQDERLSAREIAKRLNCTVRQVKAATEGGPSGFGRPAARGSRRPTPMPVVERRR